MVTRFVPAHELEQSWIVAKNGFKFLPSEHGRFSLAHDVNHGAFDIANGLIGFCGVQELLFIDLENSRSAGVMPNGQLANFRIVVIGDNDGSGMVVVAEDRENGSVVIIAEHAGIQIYAR